MGTVADIPVVYAQMGVLITGVATGVTSLVASKLLATINSIDLSRAYARIFGQSGMQDPIG